MTGACALPAWPHPRAITYRGAGKLAPENTLAVFRHSASFGYRTFELDVKLSGDGASVLLHDVTLDHTTNDAGRLDALTLDQIAQLNAGSWHSPAYTGEPVPTLAAIVRYLHTNNFLANIEIKPVPGVEWRTGAAVALDVRTLWAGAAAPPLLSLFSEDALAAARGAVPKLPRALLLDKFPADWLDRLRASDCVAFGANRRKLTPEIINQVHATGFRVCCYTVNGLDRAHLLWGVGPDGLTIDWVDRISPARV